MPGRWVLTSPMEACLNQPYSLSSSSSVGFAVSFLTSSAALRNSGEFDMMTGSCYLVVECVIVHEREMHGEGRRERERDVSFLANKNNHDIVA